MFLNSESRPDADLPCPAGYPNGALYFPSGAALANKAVWNTTHWFSEGVSSYHGLAVDLNRHWANGLQSAAFTPFESAGRWRQSQYQRCDEFPCVPFRSVASKCGLWPRVVRCAAIRRDSGVVRSAVWTPRLSTWRILERVASRQLAGQRHCHAAVRAAVHATVVIQPVE